MIDIFIHLNCYDDINKLIEWMLLWLGQRILLNGLLM